MYNFYKKDYLDYAAIKFEEVEVMKTYVSRAIAHCLFYVLVSLLLFGCTESADNDYLKARADCMDASLSKISASVAVMNADLRLNRELSCTMSEILPGFKNRCNFFVVADNATRPVIAHIKETGMVPKEIFSLVVLLPDEDAYNDNAYRSMEIGPFLDVADCRKLELIARMYKVPVESCKACQPY